MRKRQWTRILGKNYQATLSQSRNMGVPPVRKREYLEGGRIFYTGRCSKCGEFLLSGANRFCPKCGRKILWEAK